MATTKKTTTERTMFAQFTAGPVMLTARFAAESLEQVVERGRAMRLTDIVDLGDTEWVDGDIRLTGVFEL